MMLYEWDEEKDKINQRKHGMSLNAGVPVFEDDFRLELYDEINSRPHEDRYITIGHNKVSDILYVVYTMRGFNKTRLISVRRAEPHERRLYQTNIR